MATKSELISLLHQKIKNMPEKQIFLGTTHIIEKICQALAQKKRVEIRGFGAFSLRHQAPRRAHNPKTGEKLELPSRYLARFKASKELLAKLNVEDHHKNTQC